MPRKNYRLPKDQWRDLTDAALVYAKVASEGQPYTLKVTLAGCEPVALEVLDDGQNWLMARPVGADEVVFLAKSRIVAIAVPFI